MGELAKLINIGKEVERQLNDVGIFREDELKQLGSKEAWLRIKRMDDSACIHRLYALEGAICGVKKSELSKEKKEELKEFYNIQTIRQ
ncbi:MAG: TfoX/Sxy family protein [Velocimicrobium sp.]